MSNQQFDFGTDDELEEEREQAGEEWAEDAGNVLGQQPARQSCWDWQEVHGLPLRVLGQEGRPHGEVLHRALPLLLHCACLS